MRVDHHLEQARGTGPAETVRVMVVDDSVVVRSLIARWIDAEPGLTTVARYANGRLALDGIASAAPDVVVLDIEMPVMDGLTALPLLRRACPKARVIVVSTLTRRNAEISLKALSMGAADYVPKPSGEGAPVSSAAFRDELIRKIRGIGPVRLRSPQLAERPRTLGHARALRCALSPQSGVAPSVIVIGSSTGGPQALMALMPVLRDIIDHVPLLLVQHMPPTITAVLAQHLARVAARPAREAQDGEPIAPGAICVAPGGRHMLIEVIDGRPVIRLDDGPEVHFCRPAVDPLFESAARAFGPAVLGIVLTGMGQDGAAGAKRIAKGGGSVIAQDEATSVVWGMPGAAAATGACCAVLPIDLIGPKVVELCKGVCK